MQLRFPILLALLTLPLAAVLNAQQPSPSSGASSPCADTKHHNVEWNFIGDPVGCSCSDGTVAVTGKLGIPGLGGVGGTYSGGSGLAVCKSYIITPAYDERIDGQGNSIVVPGGKVEVHTYTSTCDFTGCHKFLGFLWTYGNASCKLEDKVTNSFVTYVETGQACTKLAPSVVTANASSPLTLSPSN